MLDFAVNHNTLFGEIIRYKSNKLCSLIKCEISKLEQILLIKKLIKKQSTFQLLQRNVDDNSGSIRSEFKNFV